MNTIEWTFELRFVVAVALGFLVGLERESTKFESQKLVFGGVRTHPIISMFGFGCAWLFHIGVVWMLPAGLMAIGALTSIAYIAKIKAERFGSTSEISALLTFITGALALLADVWVAMAIGIINTLLLSEKAMLESYVERLNRVEFLAVMKFLLVTLIIYPILPDQDYTRFHLNPVTVWKLVILVSTIGFVGYYLEKRFGERMGLWMSGVLGGIVSSTALTIAVGRIAQKHTERSSTALQSALVAGSVSYLRILVLVAVVNGSAVGTLWWKLLILAAIGAGLAFATRRSGPDTPSEEVPSLQNPFEIRPAIGFGLLFVIVTAVTVLVRSSMGDSGIYALAALVGVSDITPFVLSMVQSATIAWPLIAGTTVVAMMSNTLAKGVYFGFLVPGQRRQTTILFGIWTLLHIPFLLF